MSPAAEARGAMRGEVSVFPPRAAAAPQAHIRAEEEIWIRSPSLLRRLAPGSYAMTMLLQL